MDKTRWIPKTLLTLPDSPWLVNKGNKNDTRSEQLSALSLSKSYEMSSHYSL